jgi:CHAT domain-containing protein
MAPYTLLHIVCHGRLLPESGETVLYLADEHNQVEPMEGSRLLERLHEGSALPHFVFLATCESGSPEAEGVLGGLAQRLVRELGLPAVLAMTEQVSITTTQALARQFYPQLLQTHGYLALALVDACAGLAERPDVTVPVLYSAWERILFLSNR